MSKLSFYLRAGLALGLLLSQSKVVFAYCGGAITAARINTCAWQSSSGNTTESYYCAVNSVVNGPWSCDGTNSSNCQANLGGFQSCSTGLGTGACSCGCEAADGTPIAGDCSGPAAQGRSCGGDPYAGSCQCHCNPPLAGCSGAGTGGSVSCWVADPTVTPNGNSGGNPTGNPTASPPSPTPTPFIAGRIYEDANDGGVGIANNACIKTSGPDPTPVALNNANVQAMKQSSSVVSHGVITGSSYTISQNLVSGAIDYTVSLLLPTPASSNTLSYVCSCPVNSSNEYLCQYSNLSANGSADFFVKRNTLTNAWWQTYGGSVYARDEIQTQIPVNTCETSSDCQSALIVGSGENTSGLAVLGTGGVLKTTSTGEIGYIQSVGNRTSADGGYAIGTEPGNETYSYFSRLLKIAPSPFTNASDLQSQITDLAPNTTGIFIYTGAGDLIIDKSQDITPLIIPSNRKVVVFAPTNLKFTNTSDDPATQLTSVSVGSFLMFLTQGTITVDPTVGHINPDTIPTTTTANLSGVFVADQQIIIQGDGDTTGADRKFIGAGTFVAWDLGQTGNAIDLQRSFTNSLDGSIQNSTTPTEVFVYRPDFVANFPIELKSAHFYWRETAPKKVD